MGRKRDSYRDYDWRTPRREPPSLLGCVCVAGTCVISLLVFLAMHVRIR